MRLRRLSSQINSLTSQGGKVQIIQTYWTIEKSIKKGRGFHRGNLARQGICLGWQGTSFSLDPLTPCTNPSSFASTLLATRPEFNLSLFCSGHSLWREPRRDIRQPFRLVEFGHHCSGDGRVSASFMRHAPHESSLPHPKEPSTPTQIQVWPLKHFFDLPGAK